MQKLIIVSGVESSGNRAVSAIIANGGADGRASTNQPLLPEELPLCPYPHLVAAQDPEDLPEPRRPVVIIKHHRLHWWWHSAIERGYGDVRVVLLVREPFAQGESWKERGHCPDFYGSDAQMHRKMTLWRNVDNLMRCEGARWDIFSYEALAESGARRYLLRFCGLDESCADELLYLPGQAGEPVPMAPLMTNRKHYDQCPKQTSSSSATPE